MRAAVLKAFPGFTVPFEGSLNFMYLDALGLVTTGRGNLIDPVSAALALPWLHADGSPASQQEIADCWNLVKSRTDMTQQGGAAYVNVPGNDLRLGSDELDTLMDQQLTANESLLRGAFPSWDSLPADAQMGILSMAWAMGAGFPAMFPKFTKAVNAGDWATAIAQCQMAPTPGIGPRNAANLVLFQNAKAVAEGTGDPDTLYYPGTPTGGGGWGHKVATVIAFAGLGYGAWRLYQAWRA